MHIQEFGIHLEWRMICDHSEASQSPNPDTRIQIDLDVYHPLMSECPFLRIFSQHLNGKLLKVLFGLHPKESTWGPPPTSSMHAALDLRLHMRRPPGCSWWRLVEALPRWCWTAVRHTAIDQPFPWYGLIPYSCEGQMVKDWYPIPWWTRTFFSIKSCSCEVGQLW